MKDLIWYEKVRPHSIDDMVLPVSYDAKFREYLGNKTFPHLLFVGPPGSGKTTLAKIFINTIPSVSLQLNASSERGIDIMREKVNVFASSKPPKGKIKIVFLDEADMLTLQAQESLRNTMETYSKTCRFILTGNHQDKITDALQSRCSIFKFESFPKRKVLDILTTILKDEEITYSIRDLQNIIETYYPDIRSIINNLEIGSINGAFDIGLIPNAKKDMDVVINNLFDGNVKELRLLFNSCSGFSWFYKGMFDYIITTSETIEEKEKSELLLILSEYMYRDVSVLDREINTTACCIELMEKLGCKIHFNS